LQLVHAPEQTLLQIHHPVGVGEVAWQLPIGTLELTRPLAQVALLQRHVLAAARRRPECLAAIDVQITRIGHGIADHGAIALDLALARIVARRLGDSRKRRQKQGQHQNCQARMSPHAVSSRFPFITYFGLVFTKSDMLICPTVTKRRLAVKDGNGGTRIVRGSSDLRLPGTSDPPQEEGTKPCPI
jgi:hypothetical protein